MNDDVVERKKTNSRDKEAAELKPGKLLRRARERQEMSLETLASTLKVPVYKLKALEEDRWEVLGNSAFVRSLALSVCRFLQVPVEPVLAGLPKHETAKISSNSEGINTPFKEKALPSLMSSASGGGMGVVRKLVIVALVVLAILAGVYFLASWQNDANNGVGVSDAAAEPAVDASLFMPTLPSSHVAVAEQAQIQTAVVQNIDTQGGNGFEPLGQAGVVKLVSVSHVVTEHPAPGTAVVVPAVAQVESREKEDFFAEGSVNKAMLRFTSDAETWLQVRNAQQEILVERILKAGETYENAFAGRPLQVVVGNAADTQLEIDGAAFDLAAVARSNVARFEVK